MAALPFGAYMSLGREVLPDLGATAMSLECDLTFLMIIRTTARTIKAKMAPHRDEDQWSTQRLHQDEDQCKRSLCCDDPYNCFDFRQKMSDRGFLGYLGPNILSPCLKSQSEVRGPRLRDLQEPMNKSVEKNSTSSTHSSKVARPSLAELGRLGCTTYKEDDKRPLAIPKSIRKTQPKHLQHTGCTTCSTRLTLGCATYKPKVIHKCVENKNLHGLHSVARTTGCTT